MKITAAQMRQDLRSKQALRKKRAGGSGEEFPLRVAKVTRVDSKKMSCSLFCLTGNEDSYDDIAITFPGAGGRSFLGVMPEVNDLCVVGFSPAESGSTRVPYIVGWLVASAAAGYDWVVSSATAEEDLNLTPELKETLTGSYGRRRLKLRQMEAGNLVGSSSQGSDLVLNENALLANRRGNEILLRDADQALVTRSLQRFHAEAGVRVYSGMIQRDATLLPTQMFSDGKIWYGDKQVDEDGNPLFSSEFETDPDLIRKFSPNSVFDPGVEVPMTLADPLAFMQRGLYIDSNGEMYDGMVSSGEVYGGKPIFRVSVDGENGVVAPGSRVFSEYRIEVSHTSDGTLPVTEQTDGVDIDRLLPTAPTGTADGGGDLNPLNRSPNESMASLVLGTAVGNDPYWDRESYGVPLVPQIYDNNGVFSPSIRGAFPGEAPTEHAAFLVRVRNPYDLKAPEAFFGITKGGTLRSYFPGTGSPSHQEFYQTGKQGVFGANTDGTSYSVQGDGLISLKNTGRGRPTDNLGVEISSIGGAVSIYGGAAASSGADGLYPVGGAPVNAITMQSAKGTLISSVETLSLSGQAVVISDADTVAITANNLISLQASDTLDISAKSYALAVNGNANQTFGGPKNALPTNGPLRTTTFTGNPATGFIGGTVDEYNILMGNYEENIIVGNHFADVTFGSYQINVANPIPNLPIPGSSVTLSWGPTFLDQSLSLSALGADLSAFIGTAKVEAKIGTAKLSGKAGVSVTSLIGANIAAPLVTVTVGTVQAGGVMTDGCLDPMTGRPFILSGSLGVPNFRVF